MLQNLFGNEPEPEPPVPEPEPPKSEGQLQAERMMSIRQRYSCSGITPTCVQLMAFGELDATCNACDTKFRPGGKWA
ncbi:hypothetical protein [Rhizobium sp. RAF56]|uniref:hypothetical protein n=1 Tax=Rhizobium sp. RAF56 TaxID=3233062 RepID=UPI003F9A05C2